MTVAFLLLSRVWDESRQLQNSYSKWRQIWRFKRGINKDSRVGGDAVSAGYLACGGLRIAERFTPTKEFRQTSGLGFEAEPQDSDSCLTG